MNQPESERIARNEKAEISPDLNGSLGLSVVLPVYQESGQIQATITRLVGVLRQIGVSFEVIPVDDGSNDGTHAALQELGKTFSPYVRVVTHPYNKGNGAAVRTGIRAARGNLIACMDADGQHDPEDLREMLPLMSDYDIVVGARRDNYAGSWFRKFANRFYNGLASWLADFRIEDLTSGYRIFRASIVKKYAGLFPARFSYPTTSTLVFLKGGYNLKYVPINAQRRQGGSSKISIMSDGWKFVVIIFKIIVLFEPLRLFLPLAICSFFLAIVSTIYTSLSIQSLHIPNSSVILFVLGVVILLLGFLSEQITATQISLRDEAD